MLARFLPPGCLPGTAAKNDDDFLGLLVNFLVT
jgi:hypothetical protein